MASASTVHPVRLAPLLLSLVPLCIVFGLLLLLGLSIELAALVALWGFIFYRLIVVRRILCHSHRRGIALMRRGRFEEALSALRESERTWRARPTLDRYHALLLGSATPYTFAVLARYNQAYALSRLGHGQQAIEVLDSIVEEDPGMQQARELRDVLLAGRSPT